MSARILQPPGWAKPRGYSNGISTRGRLIFISGQIGWNAECEFTSDTLVGQVRQALHNIVAVLSEADATPRDLVRLTWYITARDEYLASLVQVGEVYREVIGWHFPTMSVVEVAALVESRAKVEIEATAVVPDDRNEGSAADGELRNELVSR
jgi:enamine deaminase RidA (YjgF/YER057c/UK114 family)